MRLVLFFLDFFKEMVEYVYYNTAMDNLYIDFFDYRKEYNIKNKKFFTIKYEGYFVKYTIQKKRFI